MRAWLVTAWRLAIMPTMRSPVLENATTDGVVRPPSALGMTTGSPPSITATQLLVVPRSIPMIYAMLRSFNLPDPDTAGRRSYSQLATTTRAWRMTSSSIVKPTRSTFTISSRR